MAGPSVEFLIGHKIRPMHLLKDPEGAGLKALDARGKCLTEKTHLGSIVNSYGVT